MQKKYQLKVNQKDKQEIPAMQEQPQQQSNQQEELEVCMNSDEELENQAKDQVKQLQLHKFIQNKEQMFDKIKQLCDESVNLIERNLFQESNYFLEQAEEIIEVKILSDSTKALKLEMKIEKYQKLWKLDKCNKYIDAVIYNLETSLKNDFWPEYQNFENQQILEKISYKIKRQTFLVRCYLQQCAILSQLVLHQQAIQTAKKAISVLEEIFKQCLLICQDRVSSQEQQASSVITVQKQSTLNASLQSTQSKSDNKLSTSQKNIQTPKDAQIQIKPAFNSKVIDLSNEQDNDNQNSNSEFFSNGGLGIKKSIAKEEVIFSKIIQQQAFDFLKTFEQKVIFDTSISEECTTQLKKARQSIYFWKNNPDNNERNMRQELNVPTKNTEDDNRNIVGVQKSQEWIEQFNIGSIMHMTCIQYDEFTLFEDILFELSKKLLIEKVEYPFFLILFHINQQMLFLSICFFTIATEIRFIELDKQKSSVNSKTQSYDLLKQDSYKQSEIYHLKSIEIVCQAVTCYSPYITHLINSYHKHYNSSLELIEEEASILSQLSHFDALEEFHNYQKDTTLSKNTTGILENSELQETITIIKHQTDQINPSKPYIAQKYMYTKLLDTQNKGSLSFNSFTNSSRSPQKESKARKRSPQNIAASSVSHNQEQSHSKDVLDKLTKRPKSQHNGVSQDQDISPLLNVKIAKNQVAGNKKQFLALDLETINSTFANQNNSQNNGSKTQQSKDLQNQIRKQNPSTTLPEDNKKLLPKQKENLSQNNMNQLSILRNYSSSNGSPRQNGSSNPIKNIFSGKSINQSSQQQQQQPYLLQNQQYQNSQQQQQQQQQQSGYITQSLSSSQQFQQQLQSQQLSLSTQQQQLLKALQNSKINSNQISQSSSQQQSQKNINFNYQQLQISNNQANIQPKSARVFTDLDVKNINEQKQPENQSGSQSHRSITSTSVTAQNSATKQQSAQLNNQNTNINTTNSNSENKLVNSLLKSSNSQRNIQIGNSNLTKQQQQYLKQISSQNNQVLKSIKNEINISPKQTHHFLQQFDFISSKNGILTQQNSKESQPITNSGQNSARSTQANFNVKGIPKLDLNQIQSNMILKTEENIRFFSARDHSAKKINNYTSKQN